MTKEASCSGKVRSEEPREHRREAMPPCDPPGDRVLASGRVTDLAFVWLEAQVPRSTGAPIIIGTVWKQTLVALRFKERAYSKTRQHKADPPFGGKMDCGKRMTEDDNVVHWYEPASAF